MLNNVSSIEAFPFQVNVKKNICSSVNTLLCVPYNVPPVGMEENYTIVHIGLLTPVQNTPQIPGTVV